MQLSKRPVYWYSPYQTLQWPARSLVLTETGTLARLTWLTESVLTMLRTDLTTCCLWPTVSKTVSPKYFFPGFWGASCTPPSPAVQFAFAEGTPQCRSCPSVPSGHRGCGLGEPSCPQKYCCRGVINIPIGHVPCWLASRDKCSAHVPVERGDFPGLIQCFPFLLSYTPISAEAMNMSCWISIHPANFSFSQGEIFII